MIRDNKDTYNRLREQYPFFIYKKFQYSFQKGHLSISFEFDLSGKYTFRPTLNFDISRLDCNFPDKEAMDNLVFHIGMIELISYWKLTCSPLLVIEPFNLSEEQIAFWTKLYYNGLGEFFYINSISANQSEFISLTSHSEQYLKKFNIELDPDQVLVPIGGGKDSNLSLELLKDNFKLIPFIVNPRNASIDSVRVAGFDDDQIFKVSRKLDPLMIQLNGQGFLNGHTPFSALLGFVSLLAAAFTGSKYIALSNESSANEPTVKNGPNHQYSKSFEFEKDFRDYVKDFINEQIEYFSFLRPLSELQIARLFSQKSNYFPVFKSCNVGSKTDSWCGKCPKCLFTFIILSPFVSMDNLLAIFGENLFENGELLTILEELSGIHPIKPFECVGTVDEVILALSATIEKYEEPLPVLLEHFRKSGKVVGQVGELMEKQLTNLEAEHFIPPQFYEILTRTIDVS